MPPEKRVSFESESAEFGTPPERKAGMDIIGALVRWGMVSSRQEAQYVLIGVLVVVVLLIVWVIWPLI